MYYNRQERKYWSKDRKFHTHWIENPDNGCWEWTGGKNNVGYGMFRDGAGMRTAHRVSYELHKGKIPKGKHVCHSCDNPKCVNPDHLWVGTHQDNMQDRSRKNRNSFQWKIDTCKYCKATMHVGLLKRWHNENCKHK